MSIILQEFTSAEITLFLHGRTIWKVKNRCCTFWMEVIYLTVRGLSNIM